MIYQPPPLKGFTEPKVNFYKNPSWYFDLCKKLRTYYPKKSGSTMIVFEELLKTNYLLVYRKTKRGITTAEIKNGFKSKTISNETGTRLDYRTIRSSLELLMSLSMVTKNTVNGKEYYRINEELISSTEDKFEIKNEKFSFECTPINKKYFTVSNDFTSFFYHNNNFWLRLICLYLMDHSCGKYFSKDVWLDKDDFKNGRKFDIGDDRYDRGLELDESCIWRALQKGIELKIIVWTDKNYDGTNRKLYNLKFEGDQVDENNRFLGTLPWEKQNSNYKKDEKTKQFQSIENLLIDQSFIPNYCNSTQDANSEIIPIDEFAHEKFINAYSNYINAFTNYIDTCQISGFTTNPNYIYAMENFINDDDISKNVLETDNNAANYYVNADDHYMNVEKQAVKEKPNNSLTEFNKKPEEVTIDYDQKISSAVISGDKKTFLKSLGVRNPNLQKICDLQVTDEYIFAWTLFKYAHSDFRDNPELGFLVKSLLDNADPPMEYLLISNLSVGNWLDIFEILSDEQNKYDPPVYLLETELIEMGLLCKKILGSSIKNRIPKILTEFSINILSQEEQND